MATPSFARYLQFRVGLRGVLDRNAKLVLLSCLALLLTSLFLLFLQGHDKPLASGEHGVTEVMTNEVEQSKLRRLRHFQRTTANSTRHCDTRVIGGGLASWGLQRTDVSVTRGGAERRAFDTHTQTVS